MSVQRDEGVASDPRGSGERESAAPGADSSDRVATPGFLLRTERERRGMTVLQAAEALHLDPTTLIEIEADRFSALGAPVYAKGHLRRYATVLGLSSEQVIERYQALTDVPEVPMPMRSGSQWRERSSSKLPLWITMALLAAGAAWGFYGLYQERLAGIPAPGAVQEGRRGPLDGGTGPAPAGMGMAASETAASQTSKVAAGATSSQGSMNETAPPDAAAVPSASPGRDVPAQPVIAQASLEHTAAPADEARASAVPVTRLRLTFSGTSWTEVYDAAGRQLAFGTGTPGTVRELQGTPPLRVVLGYASGVSAQVDDQAIVIPRQAGRDAARFVIAADGSVSMVQ